VLLWGYRGDLLREAWLGATRLGWIHGDCCIGCDPLHRAVEELLVECGVEVDHVTVYRWVLRFTPLLADAALPCRHRVGDRWQVDETNVKVAGQWRYVYRAIDQFGQVIDVFVSPRRDVRAARRFFQQAISATKVSPAEVTTDQASVYPAYWRRCCQRPGIALISTPTTGSSVTTAD
jgi:transposase-like protein